MASTGVAIGLNSGFRVTKVPSRPRIAGRKGHRGTKKVLIREVIREVSGYAPYEKRILELLRNGLDKKALRLAKSKLGTHLRGKKKREEMQKVLQQQTLAARTKEAADKKAHK